MPTRTRAGLPRRRASAISALTLAAAVALSACGDSSSDSSTTGSAASSAGGATGKPIKIGLIFTEGIPGFVAGEPKYGGVAAAAYINANGGIGGRPIEFVECNDRNDPAQDSQCARKFVDEKVVAVVGQSNAWGPNGLSVTSRAGIPSMTRGIFDIEATDPTSFPRTAPLIEFEAIAKWIAQEEGAKNVPVMVGSTGIALAQKYQVTPLKEKYGATDSRIVEIQSGAADYAAPARQAVSGNPDGILFLGGATDCPRIWQAVRQAGFDGVLGGSSTCLNLVDSFQPAASAAQNVAFTSPMTSFQDSADPEVATYLQYMKSDGENKVSVSSQVAFGIVVDLAGIIEKAGAADVSSKSLLSYMQNDMTEIDAFMGPKVTKADALPDYPQLWFTKVKVLRWSGEALEDVSGSDGFISIDG